jgi:hypothetical protein
MNLQGICLIEYINAFPSGMSAVSPLPLSLGSIYQGFGQPIDRDMLRSLSALCLRTEPKLLLLILDDLSEETALYSIIF